MKNIVLSVIMTAHNMQDYVIRCLQSIDLAIGEQQEKCEVICIDDSSSDNTTKLLRSECEKRIIIIIKLTLPISEK